MWVDATYLTQPGDRGLHKKLLKKRLGLLRVLQVFHSDRQMALPVGDRGAPSAYRLQTPKQWKVHDVFTVDRLSPVERKKEKKKKCDSSYRKRDVMRCTAARPAPFFSSSYGGFLLFFETISFSSLLCEMSILTAHSEAAPLIVLRRASASFFLKPKCCVRALRLCV